MSPPQMPHSQFPPSPQDALVRCPSCGSTQFFGAKKVTTLGWVLYISAIANLLVSGLLMFFLIGFVTIFLSPVLAIVGFYGCRKHVNTCAKCKRDFDRSSQFLEKGRQDALELPQPPSAQILTETIVMKLAIPQPAQLPFAILPRGARRFRLVDGPHKRGSSNAVCRRKRKPECQFWVGNAPASGAVFRAFAEKSAA
jgi:DNA-directed RNA polymerase subunit RPC12/RpoP